MQHQWLCIGVSYWLGKKDDYTGAVEALKASGIADEIGAPWVDVTPDAAVDDPIIALNRALGRAIRQYPEHTPLIFAADCTSCLGAVQGLQQDNLHVLWYDAHGDFNTPETTGIMRCQGQRWHRRISCVCYVR